MDDDSYGEQRTIERVLNDSFYGENRATYKKYEGLRLSEDQKQTLREWARYYRQKPSPRGGAIRRASLRNTLVIFRILGLELCKPYRDASRDDLLGFFERRQHLRPATLSNWKANIRTFYKWLYGITDRGRFPPVVDHELLKPAAVKTSRTPDMLLTKDEIRRMLEGALCYRDKVLIMLTYGEASMRAGEIESLDYSTVELQKDFCRLWVARSKSKPRRVLLVDTLPYLREYLNKEYSLEKGPRSPLFYSIGAGRGVRLQARAVSRILQRCATRAGITKRVFAHLGRHQSITQWSRDGLDLALNAKRAGISLGTLEKVYLQHTIEDVEQAQLAIRGALSEEQQRANEEERQKLTARRCAGCGELNGATVVSCRCGAYVDAKAAVEAEERRVEIERTVVEELVKQRVEEVVAAMVQRGQAVKMLKEVRENRG